MRGVSHESEKPWCCPDAASTDMFFKTESDSCFVSWAVDSASALAVLS